MDPDELLPASKPRKVRFAPKAPPRRTSKPPDPKTEIVDDDDDAPDDDEAAYSLRRLVDDRLGRRGPKVEKKSSVQVAFAHNSASSASIRSYGVPREGNSSKSNGLGSRDAAAADDEQILSSLPSTGEPYGTTDGSKSASDASSQKRERVYREPWDYQSNYPVTLPLRMPNSGDPELLNEEEFGDAADNLEYDEKTINSALELGLLEKETDEQQMIFLQFPPKLPLPKRSASADGTQSSNSLTGSTGASASAKGKEIASKFTSTGRPVASAAVKGKQITGKSTSIGDAGASASPIPLGKGNASKMRCNLEDLPAGRIGKMLVYKSGAVKLKLGNVIYDVSPGVKCTAAQDVVAINTVDKNCCALGELHKRAVLSPDIDSLLDSVIDVD